MVFKATGTGYDYQETQCKWRKETGGLSPKAKLTGWKEDKSKKKMRQRGSIRQEGAPGKYGSLKAK